MGLEGSLIPRPFGEGNTFIASGIAGAFAEIGLGQNLP